MNEGMERGCDKDTVCAGKVGVVRRMRFRKRECVIGRSSKDCVLVKSVYHARCHWRVERVNDEMTRSANSKEACEAL